MPFGRSAAVRLAFGQRSSDEAATSVAVGLQRCRVERAAMADHLITAPSSRPVEDQSPTAVIDVVAVHRFVAVLVAVVLVRWRVGRDGQPGVRHRPVARRQGDGSPAGARRRAWAAGRVLVRVAAGDRADDPDHDLRRGRDVGGRPVPHPLAVVVGGDRRGRLRRDPRDPREGVGTAPRGLRSQRGAAACLGAAVRPAGAAARGDDDRPCAHSRVGPPC